MIHLVQLCDRKGVQKRLTESKAFCARTGPRLPQFAWPCRHCNALQESCDGGAHDNESDGEEDDDDDDDDDKEEKEEKEEEEEDGNEDGHSTSTNMNTKTMDT